MEYQVTLFDHGYSVWRGNVPAKTAKAAVVDAASSAYASFTHISVQNKKRVVRFNRKFKKVSGDIHMFKTYAVYKPAIMLMVGNMPEIYRYNNETTRDKIYEELCTTCMSAESVTIDEEQTDITASSGETSGSKSGLMCQKILNGSVTSATWQERLTQSSIDKPSGITKSKNTAKPIWSRGSKASPSKRSQIFLATVKSTLPPVGAGGESVTHEMYKMIGQTIIVQRLPSLANPEYKYEGANWYWKAEWLDFENVYACVKNIPVRSEADTLVFFASMRQPLDRVIRFHPCDTSSPVHYTKPGGSCYALSWLQPMGKQQYTNNYKATEKYLLNNKFEQLADKVYTQKKYVKKDASTIKKAIKKVKAQEEKAKPHKYFFMPLAANDKEKMNESMEKDLEKMKFNYYGSPFLKKPDKPFHGSSS